LVEKKWIFVTSPENFEVCCRYNVFGVDERYEVTATKNISEGDEVFFYITRKRVFKGPWKVKKKGEYQYNHPAVIEWKPPNKYFIVIELERSSQLISIPLTDELRDKLLFITNKKKGSGGYSDSFQFSIISIRDEDYKTILSFGTRTFMI